MFMYSGVLGYLERVRLHGHALIAQSTALQYQSPDKYSFLVHLCRLGAHYNIEGVADSAVLVLAKFTSTLNPSIPKPRVAFGRDPKACAAVEAMLQMVNRQVPLKAEALARDAYQFV